jgi:hypothetical protein
VADHPARRHADGSFNSAFGKADIERIFLSLCDECIARIFGANSALNLLLGSELPEAA